MEILETAIHFYWQPGYPTVTAKKNRTEDQADAGPAMGDLVTAAIYEAYQYKLHLYCFLSLPINPFWDVSG